MLIITTKQPKVMLTEDYHRMQRDSVGLCLACGEESHGVAPAADGYYCDACDRHAVKGIEDCLVEGLIEVGDG